MPEIDNLSISIKASADSAEKSLDRLVDTIGRISASLGGVNFNGFAQGAKNLSTAMQGLQNVKMPDYTRLAKGIEKIGSINSAQIQSAGTAIRELSSSLRFLDDINVSDNAKQIAQLANGISQLGYKSSTKAIDNIPKLATAMRELMATLSTAPRVSQKIIDMTNALAKLSRTGASSGRAATSLGKALDAYTLSTSRASKGSWSLASAIGKLYATYWLLFRAFGKIGDSIDISSSLTEVQNVVDVTFGEYASLVEKMSETSIADFGMSELTVKQVASRFQAMGSAMGFAQGKMADMSIELTKLTADMASFYNVEQTDVAEDLESIFTGQTRPMRTYGIDLTEATLKEWALKQGMDANIDSMTQMEKTMLRYQYVLANTTSAQGDFLRTADTWANQTRILKQNFEQLGAIIGGTFINMLKPLVKALNNVMSHIIAFAETVSNALGKIFGWKYEVGVGGVTSDLEDGAGYSDDIASGLDDAQKNAKKMRDYVLGIDELNIISPDTDTSTSGGGTGGAGGATGGQWVEQDSVFKEFESEIDTLYELGETIRDALIGAMESIDWESVYEKARGFGKGLAEFLNGLLAYDGEGSTLFGEVGKTFANTLNTIVYSAQSFAKEFDFHQFGVNLADGINNFFRNFDFEALADTLNTWVDGLKETIRGFLETLSWEDIISGITDFLGTLELDTIEFIIGTMILKTKGTELRKMVTSAILTKLSLNKITLPSLALVFPKIASVNFSSASFQVIGESIVKELENILDSILPEWLKKWIGEFVAGFSLGGVASGGNPFVAILSGLISGIPYKDILFDMSWAEYWFDEMMKSFESLSSEADWFGIGSRIIEGIAEGFLGALAFIIQPIHNLFTMIWNAICEVFGIHSPAENMKPIGEYILLGIVEGFNSRISEFEDSAKKILNNIKDTLLTIKTNISQSWTNIKTNTTEFLQNMLSNIREKWESIKSDISEKVENIFSKISEGWENIKRNTIDFLTEIRNKIQTTWDNIKNKITEVLNNIKTTVSTVWNNVKTTISTVLNSIKTNITTVWSNIKTAITNTVKDIYDSVSEKFQAVKDAIESAMKNASSAIDTFKESVNNAISKIKDFFDWSDKDFKISLPTDIFDGFIEKVSGAISKLKDLFDFDGRSVNVSSNVSGGGSVRGYATGGYPASASLFWAGENGVPEILGTVGGRTAVAGGAEITGIRDAVYSTGQAETALLQTAVNLLQIIADKDPSINIDGRDLVSAYDARKNRNGYAF